MPKLLTGWKAKFFGLNVSAGKIAGMRVIGAPPVFYGKGILQNFAEICEQEFLNLQNTYIITGEKTYDVAGKLVAEALKPKYAIKVIKKSFEQLDSDIVQAVSKKIHEPTLLIGVGGGSKMDLTKLIATEKKVPYVLVPTALSHDGIASNYASLKNGSAIKTKRAEFILADHDLIISADSQFTKAGFGDIITNYSATHDWQLAKEKFGTDGTNFSRKVHLASWLSAQVVMEIAMLKEVHSINDMVEELILGLIASAAAMNSANSSIPCSGSEHTVEKLLSRHTKVLHGSLCAALALPIVYLQSKGRSSGDWRLYKKALAKIGLPTTINQLGLEKDFVIDAFYQALFTRMPKDGEPFDYKKHRYGILNIIYEDCKSKSGNDTEAHRLYKEIITKAMKKTGFAK